MTMPSHSWSWTARTKLSTWAADTVLLARASLAMAATIFSVSPRTVTLRQIASR